MNNVGWFFVRNLASRYCWGRYRYRYRYRQSDETARLVSVSDFRFVSATTLPGPSLSLEAIEEKEFVQNCRPPFRYASIRDLLIILFLFIF